MISTTLTTLPQSVQRLRISCSLFGDLSWARRTMVEQRRALLGDGSTVKNTSITADQRLNHHQQALHERRTNTAPPPGKDGIPRFAIESGEPRRGASGQAPYQHLTLPRDRTRQRASQGSRLASKCHCAAGDSHRSTGAGAPICPLFSASRLPCQRSHKPKVLHINHLYQISGIRPMLQHELPPTSQGQILRTDF